MSKASRSSWSSRTCTRRWPSRTAGTFCPRAASSPRGRLPSWRRILPSRKRILEVKGLNMLNPIQLTRDLIRYDTICPPGQERDCAEHLGRLLEPAGFKLSRHEFAPGRTTLVARLD